MNTKPFTVGITGAGGLVGTALCRELVETGQQNDTSIRVVRMIRSDKATMLKEDDATINWNPHGTTPDEILPAASELDAVVHLAGENIATGQGFLGFLGIRPWTEAKKKEIITSRVDSSRALARSLAATDKPVIFLHASGVGAYGNEFIDESKAAVDERADITDSPGFLAEVSRQAEAAARDNAGDQMRVVHLRLGVVLSKQGGALAKLKPAFQFGGGGIVGSGQQYFSFISIRDAARALVHCLQTPSLEGPVNVCSPLPCTNADLTSALGQALRRPTFVPLPSLAVSILFGEMGEETLLGGVKALPTKLLKSGFQFSHPKIEQAVVGALEETQI